MYVRIVERVLRIHTLSFETAAAAADEVAAAAAEAQVLLAAAAVVDSAGQRSLGSGRR